MLKTTFLFILTSLLIIWGCAQKQNVSQSKNSNVEARRAEVLFLGHESKHHDSGKYAPWMAIKLFRSGINMTYTTSLDDINAENLSKYDGLIIYANHEELPKLQEEALKSFVESGKGLIPLHSASGCFRNSEWYIKTIGGQFASHKTGVFKNVIRKPDHPVMKGIGEFETFDETYVHKNLNPDIVILGERVEGDHREPYTWIRTEGKGRVFYTAYGHEDKTWTNIGFLDLVRNGVLWALGDQVRKQIEALNIPDPDIYQADTIAGFTQRHIVPKMQQALSPAESQKIIQVPADFEIKLFAAEPDITNPIAMSWDERGRLWIVESVDYPNTFKETDGAANDRIKICEDTDGDGVADKFTVFADNLNIPTSMVFANGGVIVSMAPDFVFLKDTDGDDVADIREVIMTGWNKFDTHAGPSNLQYGFDNKIWGVTGYSGFNGKINGQQVTFPQGVYRLNPDGSDFEYLANTSNNTWGLGFSEDNNVFISTANNTHSAFYSMPGRHTQRFLNSAKPSIQSVQKIDGHYDAHPLTPNLRQVDVVGGFTSAAGHHLYTARNFPKEYWNRIAFICEPTIRLVHNAVIEKDGAGFAEKDGWNFMASSDEWFGPVQATVGPDGAVWVADWYNFIIQHNVFVPRQAPSEFVLPFIDQPHGQGNAFHSEMRDLNHGRIYKVVYKNAKKQPQMKLSKSDLPGLVATLKNDNMFWRMTAQRLLVEAQNKSVAPELVKIASDKSVDEIGLNTPAIHALWTLHGLGMVQASNPDVMKAVESALNHPAAGVRKAALQVLPPTDDSYQLLLKYNLLEDKDLNTRLAAWTAVADYPASDAIGSAVYKASLDKKNEDDKWMYKILQAAAAQHEDGFRKASAQASAGFANEIAESLANEQYSVGRKNTIVFSPDVSGKEIAIATTLSKNQEGKLEGFVVGQGGKDGGYSLYVKDNKVVFAVIQHGSHLRIASKDPLPEKFSVLAELNRGGAMSLKIDGKEVASGKAHMLFATPIWPALRSGEDHNSEDRLGDYTGGFPFAGNVQDTKVSLRKSSGNTEISTETAVKQTGNTHQISLSVIPDMMQYTEKLIKVKAGEKVVIFFDNPDGMQHNLLIIKPGTLQKVGKAADDMLRDPKATDKQYVPASSDVLHYTRLLNTGESVSLEFTAPDKPGDYPYVCTFPGHWRGMNGILRVEK